MMQEEKVRAEIERRVGEEKEKMKAEAQEEIRKGVEKAVSEFQRQQAMTEDERMAEKMRELQERERRIAMMEMRARAAGMLAERGLPVKLSEVVDFSGEEECVKGIGMLDQAFREAVQAEVVKKLGGSVPVAGVRMADPAEMTDEMYYSMGKFI